MKERQQLADLVGKNLTYLSQLEGLDFPLYKVSKATPVVSNAESSSSLSAFPFHSIMPSFCPLLHGLWCHAIRKQASRAP